MQNTIFLLAIQLEDNVVLPDRKSDSDWLTVCHWPIENVLAISDI